MGGLNRFAAIGRLTRDPSIAVLAGGKRLAVFGLAVCGQVVFDPAKNEFTEEPCYLDCKALDPPEGERGRKLASLAERYLRKGVQVYIEGRLILEKWRAPHDGTPRQAIKLLVQTVQLLDWRKVAEEEAAAADARVREEKEELARTGADVPTAFPFGAEEPDGEFDIPF